MRTGESFHVKRWRKQNFSNAQFLKAYIDIFHFILHEEIISGKRSNNFKLSFDTY